VRIPGLPLKVVAADGQYVKPVIVDECGDARAQRGGKGQPGQTPSFFEQ
jgi:FtsP/CotA-like multicopper oxidase with cupredoxin domain